MKKERFLQQIQAEYPTRPPFKTWWDRFCLEVWWSIDKNKEFVEKIPDDGECFSYVRKGKIINCICGKCF